MDPAPPPAGDPSAAWLARWQEHGDREALDLLLRAEIEILVHRLHARGLPPALSASDVAQDAVLGLVRVREAPRFERPAAMRAYLWKSALHLLAAHMERAGARLERLDASASQAAGEALATSGGLGAVEDEERALALELTLHLLAPEEARVLTLVYLEQVPLAEAAAHLGVGYEAAKKRLARARGALARKLGAWSELVG